MLVYLVALVQSLAYLGAVPVCAAFRLDIGDDVRLGVGLAAFERRFALRRAERRLTAPARRRRRGGTGLWRAARRLHGADIHLSGALGLGDAAATAMACGLLRAATPALAARAGRVRVDVRPLFDAAGPRVALEGMIRARAGQVITALAASQIDQLSRRFSRWTSTRLKAS